MIYDAMIEAVRNLEPPYVGPYDLGSDDFDKGWAACHRRVLAILTAATPKPCTMGVGCDESGVCYAAAHGEPERCPREGK